MVAANAIIRLRRVSSLFRILDSFHWRISAQRFVRERHRDIELYCITTRKKSIGELTSTCANKMTNERINECLVIENCRNCWQQHNSNTYVSNCLKFVFSTSFISFRWSDVFFPFEQWRVKLITYYTNSSAISFPPVGMSFSLYSTRLLPHWSTRFGRKQQLILSVIFFFLLIINID